MLNMLNYFPENEYPDGSEIGWEITGRHAVLYAKRDGLWEKVGEVDLEESELSGSQEGYAIIGPAITIDSFDPEFQMPTVRTDGFGIWKFIK